MAQKTTVVLIDDLDGGDADESVSFGLDGVEYTIDLSSENAQKLRESVAMFADAGRRIGGRNRASHGRQGQQAKGRDRAQSEAIREWARRMGKKVSDRGRISAEVVRQFEEAHAQ